MKSILPKFAAAVILCFSIGAEATDKKSNSAHEAKRVTAIKQIDDFAERMAKLDPTYKAKENKIVAAVPLIAKNYSPDQWLERVQFLYAVLSEIDAKAVSIDPEAILAKYYPDEAQRAPSNVLQIQAQSKESIMRTRHDELQKQLDENTVDLTEHAARMLASALVYFPNDDRFISLRRYRLDLALRNYRGEIDRSQLEAAWAIKRHEYNDGQERKRVLQAQQQEYLAEQANAQQKVEASQRWGNILSGAARGMQNAANQQRDRTPVTCTAVANIMTCR